MADNEKSLATPYMQNRELSWLEFNKRVLDQGADPTVPLLERLNFISIFWSNLQEFFMVRVGSLTDLSLVKKHIIDSKSGMTPSEQLDAIYTRCHELYGYYQETYENLRSILHDQGIYSLRPNDLNDEQRAYVLDYLEDNVIPFLSPQIINSRHPFPHLENGALYVVVRLDEHAEKPARAEKSEKGGKNDKGEKGEKSEKSEKGDKDSKGKSEKAATKQAKTTKNVGAEDATLGLIPLPRQSERLIILPGKGLQFMLLEHALEMVARDIFSMYKVKHTNIICVTRNADLDATEGTDEQDEDYREHMKRILKKRSRLAPVRLESERELSTMVKNVLMKRLGLKPHQLYYTSVPLDLSYTWGLGSRLSAAMRAPLVNSPFSPQWPVSFDRNRPIMEQVLEHETLLSYPYETMDAFVQLLREAVNDPQVISIKITLYRLASQSHLAEALIAAAEAGKEVTALFELRARFDESNNIEWSQRFEQAGCNVIYGFRDYKVHSKICSITRRTETGLQYITQLGTGNYNEKTARLYTDFSFITSDVSIGRDAQEFFRNMALENASDNYDILWVAPLQIKPMIMSHIDEQIALAKAGKPSGLFFKTNSVTDKDIIEKIVEASQAGVTTKLFVRGISCIVPGVPGYTDNVKVVSIVGRLLEHSRIYCFGPRDNCRVYLSSADLMTRNMEKRVEIAWPVLNSQIRESVLEYLDTSMADTAKLRELLPDKTYTPLGFFAEKDKDGNPINLFNSQQFLIEEAQRKHLEAVERIATRNANREPLVTFSRAHVHKVEPRMGEEESEFIVPEEVRTAQLHEAAVAAAQAEAEASQASRPGADAVFRERTIIREVTPATAESPEKTVVEETVVEAEIMTEAEPTDASATAEKKATSSTNTVEAPAESPSGESAGEPRPFEFVAVDDATAEEPISLEAQPVEVAVAEGVTYEVDPVPTTQIVPAPKKLGFFARLRAIFRRHNRK